MTDDANFYADPYRVAIYTGEQSDAIEADPHADISRVKFHSALPYVTIRRVITGTVSLQPDGYDAVAKRIYNIHPHGLSFTPMVIGLALNLRARNTNGWISDWIPANDPLITGEAPISGTVMLASTELGQYGGYYKHKNIQVGVNETHVTITDVQPDIFQPPTYAPLQSFAYDLQYRIAITNFALPV